MSEDPAAGGSEKTTRGRRWCMFIVLLYTAAGRMLLARCIRVRTRF